MLQYNDLPENLREALNQKGVDEDTVGVLLMLMNAAGQGGPTRKVEWETLPSEVRDTVTRNRRIMHYEQQLLHAMAAADDEEVARITKEYNEARGVPNSPTDWLTWDADSTAKEIGPEEDAETADAVGGTAVAVREDDLTDEERTWLAERRRGNAPTPTQPNQSRGW